MDVTDTIKKMATRIDVPSNHPYYIPSLAIPNNSDATAAIQRALSMGSLKVSFTN
jgi:hypothetical protein